MSTTEAQMKTFGFVLTAALLTACASSVSAPPEGTAPVPATTPATADDVTGTWAFVLAKSDVADGVRQQCNEEAKGDAAKASACYSAVETESAREKIRFTKDVSGKMTWKSFGVDEGKEITFLEVPVTIASDGTGHVLAKIAGSPIGIQAEKFSKANVNALRIDVVDGRTIVMTDPKKGRLVYTKE
jgi:hypothetical protein